LIPPRYVATTVDEPASVYLRRKTVRKNGKTHDYWLLMRSVRQGRRVRQEIAAHLGKLDAKGRRRARALADRMTGRRMHPSLFEPRDTEHEPFELIRVNDVSLDRARRFGDAFVGLTLWHDLKRDDALVELLPPGREDVAWSTLAAALVICRLCMPSSELHLADVLYRQTALDDLLGLPEHKVNDDRLHRALDWILPPKEALEQHLRSRFGELFDVQYDLLMYDVTSTYFEGLAEANPQAQRGHSRDHRPDCKQVCIPLVVTRQGIPLAHEVFDGNRTDVTTAREIVETIERRFGAADRVWGMDREMASERNLACLKAGGPRYVIGTSRSEPRRLERQIVEQKDWRNIREDVEVKLCSGDDGQEAYILCRSEARKAKDRAIVARAADRLRARLASLQRRLAAAKQPVDRDQVNQQIGRMLEANSRAAKRFAVSLREDPSCAGGLAVDVAEHTDGATWADRSAVCYLLRSNVSGWTDDELWRTYIQLTEAESAFRTRKSDLSIRPVWHQREDRVRAHIFVCFLADALWKTLELWRSQAGLGNSPRAILEELAQVQSADVLLPTTDGRQLCVRCVVRPNETQDQLLDRLGIELPRRLTIPKPLANPLV
jgi:transposase